MRLGNHDIRAIRIERERHVLGQPIANLDPEKDLQIADGPELARKVLDRMNREDPGEGSEFRVMHEICVAFRHKAEEIIRRSENTIVDSLGPEAASLAQGNV